MAHNNYIRPGGVWAGLSVLTSVEMAAFDLAQYGSINGDNGGTWAPAAQIILGGTGLRVTGPFRADDAAITITSPHTLTINSGAFLSALVGSTSTWAGASSYSATAVTTVVSGAAWTYSSGSALTLGGGVTLSASGTLTCSASSTVVLGGATSIPSTGVLTVAASGVINVNTGTINVASGGTLAVANGGVAALNGTTTMTSTGTLTCANGSTVTFNGACAFGSTGTLSTSTGAWTLNNITTCNGSLYMATGSTLQVQTGSTLVTQAGAGVTRGASETRTGGVALSGTTAWTKWRYVLGSAVDHTYNGKDYDFIEVPTLGADVVYTFSDLSPGDYVMVNINRANPTAAPYLFAVTLKRGDASDIDTSLTNGISGAVSIFWNGSLWLKHLTG